MACSACGRQSVPPCVRGFFLASLVHVGKVDAGPVQFSYSVAKLATKQAMVVNLSCSTVWHQARLLMPTNEEYEAEIKGHQWPGLRQLWQEIKAGDTLWWAAWKAV